MMTTDEDSGGSDADRKSDRVSASFQAIPAYTVRITPKPRRGWAFFASAVASARAIIARLSTRASRLSPPGVPAGGALTRFLLARGREARLGLSRHAPHWFARGAATPGAGTASPSMGPRRWRLLRRAAMLGFACIGALAIYVAYCAFTIPLGGGVALDAPGSAMVIQAADASTIATRGNFKGEKLGAEDMPRNLEQAVVAIEDRRFYRHGGLDPRGMARALFRDTLSGHAREGASTITQQLARLMFLSPDRNLRRKVQEALITLWLEHQLGKTDILVRYLNTAYFGAGAFGADGAARRYFGKSAKDLTLPEAAMLAGLVRAPSQLAPSKNMDGARKRATLVLNAMVETGAITAAEGKAAIDHPAELKLPPDLSSDYGYVSDLVTSDVKQLIGAGPTDLTVSTTIDQRLQNLAQETIDKYLETEGAAKNASQAALVALGRDGAIVSLIGGRDYDDSQFNRATQAKRQGGSLFKLFVYMTALRKGLTPDSPVVDRPVKIGDWEPQNYENTFRGTVTARTAFAHSINTVAADLGASVGIKNVIATARDLGVKSDLPDVPSLALGTADVTLLEMTRAYAAASSELDPVEPYLVRAIKGHSGVLFTRPAPYPGGGDSDPVKAQMRDLLGAVVEEGTGRGARMGLPIGGKTGTTQDFHDAWFIGYAPDLVVGVWVGNDDNSPMKRVTGGDIPVKIWHDYVAGAEKILQGRQPATRTASRREDVKRPRPAVIPRDTPDADTADAASPESAMPDDASTDAPAAGSFSGAATVLDTATLEIDNRTIKLSGVQSERGRAARALSRYLRGRDVVCAPVAGTNDFKCSADGRDLALTMVENGGASPTPEASMELRTAAEAARAAHVGKWR